jgi:hypothetical protein
VLAALPLCTRLRAFVWSGSKDTFVSAHLLSILSALRSHASLTSLAVRTTGILTEPCYDALKRFTALESVSLWALDGPPRYMQGWAGALAGSLRSLDLGRCAGVPGTLLVSALAPLRRLRALRVRGVMSSALPRLLARLPGLTALDTDYVAGALPPPGAEDMPALRHLTVRASSIDVDGPVNLWEWIMRLLAPRRADRDREADGAGAPGGLESFTLSAFALSGAMAAPHALLAFLVRHHARTLRRFVAGETRLERAGLRLLAGACGALAELGCALAVADANQIADALAPARSLVRAALRVHWLFDGAPQRVWLSAAPPPSLPSPQDEKEHKMGRDALGADAVRARVSRILLAPDDTQAGDEAAAATAPLVPPRPPARRVKTDVRFNVDDARAMMLGTSLPGHASGDGDGAVRDSSQLRVIAINSVVYTVRTIVSTDIPRG